MQMLARTAPSGHDASQNLNCTGIITTPEACISEQIRKCLPVFMQPRTGAGFE
ncbi:hypothetical protein ALQ56_200172 [Pseudomonas syringae pv. papulans]|nr:hypothetical protein ALQ56_200172 [Pseudomonas syringae pv. papulans]